MKKHLLLIAASLLLGLLPLKAETPASDAHRSREALLKLLAKPPILPEQADLPCLRCSGTGKVLRVASKKTVRTDLGAKPILRCAGVRRIPRTAEIEKAKAERGDRIPTHRITKSRLLTSCPVCNGTGHCLREYLAEERLPTQKKLRQNYDEEQLRLGRIPVGGAYADRSTVEALSVSDHAALAHLYPKPCSTCYGFGKLCCKRCDGLGYTPGEYNEATNTLEPDTPCKTCKGRGYVPCRRCDGSGLARLCSSCDGTGLRRKRDRKAPSGYSFQLCTSCDGCGRR